MNPFGLFYGLVFVSGFSALLYEVVWQRYLAILLGAQAWATVLVLAVYLGGLSAGYFLFGRITRRYRGNLVKLYAYVEIGLAIWAFSFPLFFELALKGAPVWAGTAKWSFIVDIFISTVLLGVPTVLMGGTLPILTQGLSKGLAEASHTHARIYGFNTIGACFGCLAAGYWMIPKLGLASTTRWGGALNLIVGLAALLVSRSFAGSRKISSTKITKTKLTRGEAVLLGIGFFSGFYLLALQTVLIRLMGLATGASNYNFALIVAIFVFCLGFGSLMVRRIAAAGFERLFWNQTAAAVTLFLLYLSGDAWSWGGHVIRALLRDIPQSFAVYQGLLGMALFGLLVIPIGLSGLTLPLCFHLLKTNAEGLGQRVGWLYGVNTLGCIAGALIGGFWLLNFLNLDQVFKVCIFMVTGTAIAAGYLADAWRTFGRASVVGATMAFTVAILGTAFAPKYHRERFIQPFRHPYPMEETFRGPEAFGKRLEGRNKIVFWKDGPNTTMGVAASVYNNQEVSRSIFVNGKSDGNTGGDQLTTNMLAHIPALFTSEPSNALVIGFGTGMTVGTLLRYPEVKSVEVAEISGTIIQNAHLFDRFNGMASQSPKVAFREMDAMRLMAGANRSYDIIISEPSNPWVAGVENLFALEFYTRARASLSPHGTFVQWIHTYSFSDQLFNRIIATMGRVFPFVSVFQLKSGDYALVATNKEWGIGEIRAAEARYHSLQTVRDDLTMNSITGFPILLALQVVTPQATRQIADVTSDVHTLTHPRVSDEAARAFFLSTGASVDTIRRGQRNYFRSLDQSLLRQYFGDKPIPASVAESFQRSFCGKEGVKMDYLCREAVLMSKWEAHAKWAEPGDWWKAQSRALASLSLFEGSNGGGFGEKQLQDAYERFENYKKYASPIFRVSNDKLLKPIEKCLSSTSKKNETWGQCMLQKILIGEWLMPSNPQTKSDKKEFISWFDTVPTSMPNYGKLKEARNILERM